MSLARVLRSTARATSTGIARPAPLIRAHPPTIRTLSSTALRSSRKQSAIASRLPDPERQPQRFRDFDLAGKVFVVTGGGRGLGLTLAEVLVEAGGKGRYSVS